MQLEAAGYCAQEAPVYPQATVHMWHGQAFAIGAGGGGGAAQLMPASLLGKAIAAAHRKTASSERSEQASDHLLAFYEALDEQVDAIVDGPPEVFRGSSAQVVTCMTKGHTLWFANVGLGRAYRIESGGAIQLTRDGSLQQSLKERGATEGEITAAPSGIVTATLNGQWRQSRSAWRPAWSPVDGALGFLLASEPAHAAAPHATLTGLALAAVRLPDLSTAAQWLWTELRREAARSAVGDLSAGCTLGNFDRRASLLLIRPSQRDALY